MKLSVLSFNQAKAVDAGLDIVDLMLLDYFVEAGGRPSFKHLIREDTLYTAVPLRQIRDDLPILWLSDDELRESLTAYQNHGFLSSVVLTDGSNRVYYCVTDKTRDLMNSF